MAHRPHRVEFPTAVIPAIKTQQYNNESLLRNHKRSHESHLEI